MRRILLPLLLVAGLVFAATASAQSEQPRTGHWCGFQTSHHLSVNAEFIGPANVYVNRCQFLQETFFSHTVVDRHPVSFYTHYNGTHYYLQDFLFGFDHFLYVKSAYFNPQSMSVSENGRNIKGSFPSSGFFKGTLQHHDGSTRNIYAWFVGRHCASRNYHVLIGCS